MKRPQAALIGICIVCLVISRTASSADQNLLQMLKAGEYGRIESILDDLQKSCQADIGNEKKIRRAFDFFECDDPSLEEKLNAWISERPYSWSAYTARGAYYYAMGWKSRGGRWFDDTTVGQLKQMTIYFAKALVDLKKAAELNRYTDQPYFYMIGISMSIGNKKTTREFLDAALKLSPYALETRMHYMQSLIPRWGGSMEEMADFIHETKPYYSSNPDLKVLEGRILLEKAYQSCKDKGSDCDLPFYNEALTYGMYPSFLWSRGLTLYSLKEYGPALADFNAILDGDPFHHAALYMRAKCKIQMKSYAEAHADIERYIRDYYTNERIQALRGRVYYKEGEYNLALQDYRSAAALNPNNKNYSKKIKKIEKKIKKGATKKEEIPEDDPDEK